MVGRKKKAKICDKGSQESWICQLPDVLIWDILTHLPTKDAVKTSVLSTRWRSLWKCVPGLDLDSYAFSNLDAFVSFAERFLDSNRKSWIHKLRLNVRHYSGSMSFLTQWIDIVTGRRIQHLDVCFETPHCAVKIPSSIYTCETLVHIRLCSVVLANAECVSLPCLKILHLERIKYLNEATLEKLLLSSPVLEDLTIIRLDDRDKVIQVRSNTLKRIDINEYTPVVIDAPLLQCLKTRIYSGKNFKIINLGFSTKLDIDVVFPRASFTHTLISDILTDIPRFRALVISSVILKSIFRYLESGPLLQLRDLSCLSVKSSKSDLEMLPTLLESCPKLQSLILELVKDPSYKKNREPKVTFSTVPPCLKSSLKFVELKRLIKVYEGEIELVRYFLKNSTILEKLRLNTYYTKKAMSAFLKEVVAMPRCSSACEVLVL